MKKTQTKNKQISVTKEDVITDGKALLNLNNGKTFQVITSNNSKALASLLKTCTTYVDCIYNDKLYKIVPNFSCEQKDSKVVMGVMPIELMAVRPHIANVRSCAVYTENVSSLGFMGQNFYLYNPYWCTLYLGHKTPKKIVSISSVFKDNKYIEKIKDIDVNTNFLCTVNCLSAFVINSKNEAVPALILTRVYGSIGSFKELKASLEHWCIKHNIKCFIRNDYINYNSNFVDIKKNKEIYSSIENKENKILTLPFKPQILHRKSNNTRFVPPYRYNDYQSIIFANKDMHIEQVVNSPLCTLKTKQSLIIKDKIALPVTRKINRIDKNRSSDLVNCVQCNRPFRKTVLPHTIINKNVFCKDCSSKIKKVHCFYCKEKLVVLRPDISNSFYFYNSSFIIVTHKYTKKHCCKKCILKQINELAKTNLERNYCTVNVNIATEKYAFNVNRKK